MDYIVVQSKSMITQYDKRVPREKFLPLGSPKFDRVIRLCQNPPEPPEDWKAKMAGKRVYFYNTSLAGLLEDTGMFLRKMAYVFNTFKEVEDACILWRPHPLFEQTIDQMRPGFRLTYDLLKEAFVEEEIGIYDTTADIDATIAQCYAYIGDGGSSVVSLFEVAGKRVFLLNNGIVEAPPEDWWKGLYYYFPLLDRRLNHYIVMPEGKLFYSPADDGYYHYACDLPQSSKVETYGYSFYDGVKKGYIFPIGGQDILTVTGNTVCSRISLGKKGKYERAFSHIWLAGKYLFLIPEGYPDLIRMDMETEEISRVQDVSGFFWRKMDKTFCGGWVDFGAQVLRFVDENADNMLIIDITSLKKEVVPLHYGKPLTICQVQKPQDGRFVWLVPQQGTDVARWDRKDNSLKEYRIGIRGLYSKDPVSGCETDKNYFSGFMVFSDQEVIFCPNWGNKFVKLYVDSGQTEEWMPPFTVYEDSVNPYYFNWGRGYTFRSLDGKGVRWLNSPERKAYDIDLGQEKATPVVSELDRGDIFRLYAKGFETDQNGIYTLKESPWNSLLSITRNHIAGEEYDSKAAEKAVRVICAEISGNSGEKIYRRLAGNFPR